MVFRYFYNSVSAKVFSVGSALLSGIVGLRLIGTHLSTAEYGLFVVAAQLLNYIPLLDGGVRTVSNCELLASSDENRRAALLNFCQRFYSWFGLAMFVLMLVLMSAYWIVPKVRTGEVPLAFFLLLGISSAALITSSAQGGLLVGLQAQNAFYFVNGISNLINLVTLIIGFHFRLRLWTFILANAVMFFASWPLFIWLIKTKVPDFKIFRFSLDADFWRELRRIRNDAFASFRSQISIMFLFTLDVLIVGLSASAHETAIYGLLIRLFTILRSFLQSFGEVGWPLIAQFRGESKRWTYLLLNGNAWLHGSVAGAILISLKPFLTWYMGEGWSPANSLVGLVLLRFLITGLGNPAAYALLGLGKFNVVARWIELELAVAVALSLALLKLGAQGVALGFLVATTCGTFYPLLASYSRESGFEPIILFRGIWRRAAIAFVFSLVSTYILARIFPQAWSIVAAGWGTLIGLSVAYLSALRRRTSPFDFKTLVNNI